MAAPLFATVAFVAEGASSIEHQIFRVPIDATTTVKTLAKNAMWRLSQLQKVSNIGIGDIYVGSNEVKLFIHDIVVHVVNVKEERIVLVLKERSSNPGSARPSSSDSAVLPTTTARASAPPAETSPVPQEPTTAEQLEFVTKKLQQERYARSNSPPPARNESAPARTTLRSSGHPRMPVPVAVVSPKPLGKAPPASRDKQSPVKRQRPEADEDANRVLTPEVAKVSSLSKMTEAERQKFLRNKQKADGYQWGSEAHRQFESNYTTDPDKLARELRKRRADALRAGHTGANPVYCDADDVATTVPKAVTVRSPLAAACKEPNRQLLAELQSVADDDSHEAAPTNRPTGWGVKASLYFDANTYHDDPSKAKLDPVLLNEPLRARRFSRQEVI